MSVKPGLADIPTPSRTARAGAGRYGLYRLQRKAYPNLTALFGHLGVRTLASDMSFAVSRTAAGSNIPAPAWADFRPAAQPRQPAFLVDAARPRASTGRRRWTLPVDGRRAWRLSRRPADTALPSATTICCRWRRDLVGAAAEILGYPGRVLHPFHRQSWPAAADGTAGWRTVEGGSIVYVERLASGFPTGSGSTPRSARSAQRRRCHRHGLRGEPSTSTMWSSPAHADQALVVLADPSDERGCSARSATAATRPCCTPTRAHAAAARRLVELELYRLDASGPETASASPTG